MNLPPKEVFQSCIKNNQAYIVFLNRDSLNYKNHYTIFNTDREEKLSKDLDKQLGSGAWETYLSIGLSAGYGDEQKRVAAHLKAHKEDGRQFIPIYNWEGKENLSQAPVQLPGFKRRFHYEEIKKRYVSRYKVNVSWDYLDHHLKNYEEHYTLDLDPPFQRVHVWDEGRQIAYVEFILSGGQTAKEVYFNCPGWQGRGNPGQMVLVDGKQRIQAVSLFLQDKLEVFGGYKRSEILGLARGDADFIFYVNDLETNREVLEWYLQINEGLVPHTEEELKKVREMLNGAKDT